MMILTTLSEKTSPTQARVLWRTGSRRYGVLEVTLEEGHDESDLLAELAAIKHLLFDRQVFDRAPVSARGYKLVVSKGAIKKLALGRSTKRFAQQYAVPLTTRLEGIDIEVSQSRAWLPAEEELPVEPLYVQKGFTRDYDMIETPSMGKVLVTHHAVEQYMERVVGNGAKDPRLSLQMRLMNPELEQVPLDAKVLRHKEAKYGRADNVQIWGHPSSSTRFVVLRENPDHGVLVTVFRR